MSKSQTSPFFDSLPIEILLSITDYLTASEILKLRSVNKRLCLIISKDLLRSVHIILKPCDSIITCSPSVPNTSFKEDYENYLSIAAPCDLYIESFKRVNLNGQKVTILTEGPDIAHFIGKVIKKKSRFAQNITSFTVELYKPDRFVEFPTDLVNHQTYYTGVIEALSHPAFYYRLTRCVHFSLPIQLIPTSDLDCLKRKNILSLVLNSTYIRSKHFYDNPIYCLDSLERRRTEYINQRRNMDDTHDRRLCKKILKVWVSSLAREYLGKRSLLQHQLIASNAEKLCNFLELCTDNKNVYKIYFNGFESFHKYFDLIESVEEIDLKAKPFLKPFENFNKKKCIAQIRRFSERLCNETRRFHTIAANNSEVKCIFNQNFSMINFLEHISKNSFHLNGNRLLKCKRLSIHSSREDIQGLKLTSHWIHEMRYNYDRHRSLSNDINNIGKYADVSNTEKIVTTFRFVEHALTFRLVFEKTKGANRKYAKHEYVYPQNAFLGKLYDPTIVNKIMESYIDRSLEFDLNYHRQFLLGMGLIGLI